MRYICKLPLNKVIYLILFSPRFNYLKTASLVQLILGQSLLLFLRLHLYSTLEQTSNLGKHVFLACLYKCNFGLNNTGAKVIGKGDNYHRVVFII